MRPGIVAARCDLRVPGDPSQAAFWVVAACMVPGSDLTVEHVYVGPGRAGFVDVLQRMGADVELVDRDRRGRTPPTIRPAIAHCVPPRWEEPRSRRSSTRSPVLAVAAAFAEGVTTFRRRRRAAGQGDGPDRTTVDALRALGASCEGRPDGLVVDGECRPAPPGGAVDSAGDHRIAMAMAVAGLAVRQAGHRVGVGGRGHQLPGVRGGHRQVRVIAIDGPAGSGKSTVARAVADRLGLDYLDTGAMYRAVAFAAIRRGIDPDDGEPVAAPGPRPRARRGRRRSPVDGVDATIEIRSPEVTRAVSVVAANPEVRRSWSAASGNGWPAHGGGVIEGRDIGTVVFPDAELKVYLTADEASGPPGGARRCSDLHYDQVAADIARRDHIDSTRATLR